MALITNSTVVFTDGDTLKFTIFRVIGVNSNDTIDLGIYYKRITGAAFVSMSGGTLFSTNTVAGTIVTLTNTGLINDAGFLIVIGAST